jgi:hypothetical protein
MIRNSLLALVVIGMMAWADSAAGISWTAPGSWKSEGSRPMRAATYNVPAAGGDSEPGECGVFYFGQGQGGSVQANLDRWIGQFQQPSGKKIDHRAIHGLNVTTVEVAGAYSGMGGPMASTHSSKPGYKLLGAIVEAPQGAVFFKFTGPAKTVNANQVNFQKMIDSVKK